MSSRYSLYAFSLITLSSTGELISSSVPSFFLTKGFLPLLIFCILSLKEFNLIGRPLISVSILSVSEVWDRAHQWGVTLASLVSSLSLLLDFFSSCLSLIVWEILFNVLPPAWNTTPPRTPQKAESQRPASFT